MGRRLKLELYGLVEEAVKLHQQGQTIQQIEASLRTQGYDISREAVRRGLKGAERVAQRYREIVSQAQAIVEAVRESPNTDSSEVALALLSQQGLDYAMTVEGLEFKTPNDAAAFLRTISLSQYRLARLRLTDVKKTEQIKEQLITALTAAIEGEPILIAKVCEAVRRAEIKL